MTEQELQKLCGKENPFSVPEGYFEQFSQQMMNRIAQPAKPKAKHLWLHTAIAAAACICVAVFCLNVVFHDKVEQKTEATVAQNAYDNEYIEDAIEYAMLDNGDLYACMMED